MKSSPPKVFVGLCWMLSLLCPAQAQLTTPITYGDAWKFMIPAADPGAGWRGASFDDTTWGAGPGLFGYETAVLPAPGIVTPVGNPGSQMVYLFRKTFTYGGSLSDAVLAIDQIADDGVTYYLNGNLIGSSRHVPGLWNNASTTVMGDAVEELAVIKGPATGLVQGTNVLAAELHQSAPNNSDLVFGARLKIHAGPMSSEDWRLLCFGNVANTGNAADLTDLDHDQLTNLAEWALVRNPGTPDAGWGTTSLENGNLTLTYTRRKAALSEVGFLCIWTSDPKGTWSSTGITEQIVADDNIQQTVKAQIPVSGAPRFLKLQIRRLVTSPLAPSNAVATATSISSIVLTWTDNATNEAGYKIERRLSGGSFSPLVTVPANTTSFADTGLNSSTAYIYRVYAVNTAGDSLMTTETRATTLTPPPPSAPSSLVGSVASPTQINLTWADLSGNETGFEIEHRLSGASFSLLATVGAGVQGYQAPVVAAGATHVYRVRAINPYGASAYTADARVTTPLLAPDGLSATTASATQVNLAWADHSNETEFVIERKTGPSGIYAELTRVAADVTAFVDTSVTSFTNYTYRVQAVNAVGTSAYSAEASATTLEIPATGTGLKGDYFANKTLTGSAALTRNDAVVDFNWGAASPGGAVPADNFSSRWTGQVQPRFTEPYTFYTTSDHAARLWINGVQLVNDWVGHSTATEMGGTITLQAGEKYLLTMEHFENTGSAMARLQWSSPSTPKQVIPQSRLYPDRSILSGGVEHHNRGGIVDKGLYQLEYRPQPGSTKLLYTPRVVLKQMTTGVDMQLSKFPVFSLTPKDLTMYFSGGVGNASELVSKGWSHINGTIPFYNGTAQDRTIPWTKRAWMTMHNTFQADHPGFTQGGTLPDAELDQIGDMCSNDGMWAFFNDRKVAQWHLLDWEFAYNDYNWTRVVTRMHAVNPNLKVMDWMGMEKPASRPPLYNGWSTCSYFHLTDYQVPNANSSDGIPAHLELWKEIYHRDSWNLLQTMYRPEKFDELNPGRVQLNGYMTSYEDGFGAPYPAYDWAKLHPLLAENGPLWMLLNARQHSDREGGIVAWNAPGTNEPLTSEQYATCGFERLSFLNAFRSGSYSWVKPKISFDNGVTWKDVSPIVGNLSYSTLNVHQERNGVTVKEPHVRCLVTATHVVVFAQNPHNDAPQQQTIRISIAGVIDDYVTVYNMPKTKGALTYKDHELTIAITTRN